MAKWLDNAIFYEIYPQSFQDTNADGIGDFQGIIRRLDYIRELGCNALWINPCFQSPFGDAGYDVADYYTVAPRYGTNEDLKQLFAEAHSRGMHVLLDLVPGHTSVEHRWFQQSMKAEKNELIVQTGDGQLALLEVQLAGKKRMDAGAFMRGYTVEEGAFFRQ